MSNSKFSRTEECFNENEVAQALEHIERNLNLASHTHVSLSNLEMHRDNLIFFADKLIESVVILKKEIRDDYENLLLNKIELENEMPEIDDYTLDRQEEIKDYL